MLHGWICGAIEWDMNEKLDNTTEFVTLLNVWHCWMCGTVQWDENVDEIRPLTLLHFWICGAVAWN